MVQNCFNTLWKTPAPNDASVLMVLDEIYQLGQLEILKRASGPRWQASASACGQSSRIWGS